MLLKSFLIINLLINNRLQLVRLINNILNILSKIEFYKLED
jgi:hypothetical protein